MATNTTDVYTQVIDSDGQVYSVLDPAVLAQQPGVNREFIGLANSFSCPAGMGAGEAWLLMLRSDLDLLIARGNSGDVTTYGLDGFLQIKWTDNGLNTFAAPGSLARLIDDGTRGGMLFHKATCMSPGASATDPNAAFLVHFVDKRHLLAMSALPVSQSLYNIRCPAPTGGTSGGYLYYGPSQNSGDPYAWSDILFQLWQQLPTSIRGTVPTLPYTPDGTPENFRFTGMTAWAAIGQLLHKLKCVLVYDPQADDFTIQQLGTTQAGLSSALSALSVRLVNNYWPLERYQARFPETIRVTFPTFIQNYGSDADVLQNDDITNGLNFTLLPVWTKDVATGISQALNDTVVTLWDDMVANFASNNYIDAYSPTNLTALESRAAEVAANYVNTILLSETRQRSGYSGISTSILPGSQITQVAFHDYGNGAITEYFTFPCQTDNGAASGLAPYDLGRRITENYPTKIQLIQLTSTTPDSTSGATLFPGTVTRLIPESTLGATGDESCWVIFPNGQVPLNTSNPSPGGAILHVGRLLGTYTSSDTTLPVYGVTSMPGFPPSEASCTLYGTPVTTSGAALAWSLNSPPAAVGFTLQSSSTVLTPKQAGYYFAICTINCATNTSDGAPVPVVPQINLQDNGGGQNYQATGNLGYNVPGYTLTGNLTDGYALAPASVSPYPTQPMADAKSFTVGGLFYIDGSSVTGIRVVAAEAEGGSYLANGGSLTAFRVG